MVNYPKAARFLLAMTIIASSHICTTSAFGGNVIHSNLAAAKNYGNIQLQMAEGGDKEWSRALDEARGQEPGAFDREMKAKMQGLMGNKGGSINPKLSQNANLISWLEKEGEVYLSDASTWGVAPHPMAISTETVDETTNEKTGRGLLARRNINDGDELLMIPMNLCMTVDAARKALGQDAIPLGTNEYLGIATHLIYERFVKGEKSFWKPYIDILPSG